MARADIRIDVSEVVDLFNYINQVGNSLTREKRLQLLKEMSHLARAGKGFSAATEDGKRLVSTVTPEMYRVLERHGIAPPNPKALKGIKDA